MPDYSQIGQYVSGYDKYLTHTHASDCVKSMRKKEKGGKKLRKFFEEAVKRNEWLTDTKFRHLLDRAVEQSSKLSHDQKAKFKKAEAVFTKKIEKAKEKEKAPPKPTPPAAPIMPPAEPTPTPSVKSDHNLSIDALAAKYKLGPSSRQIAFAMDWSKDNPVLFNPAYIQGLLVQKKGHPDMQNPFIPPGGKQSFLSFLSDLMNNAQVSTMSKENTTRLRQMVLSIMNKVNEKRGEPKFQEYFAAIVGQIHFALQNCSNRVNTEIEKIFIQIAYPKDGSIGYQVRLALQAYRDQIFQKSIHTVLAKSSKPKHLEHEAASFNYYNGKMTGQFGLPHSISELDHAYESCAMKGQENKIQKLFDKEYTLLNILNRVSNSIGNVQDNTIQTKLFTDWLEARYTLEERYELLDENGHYKPAVVLELLRELQIST